MRRAEANQRLRKAFRCFNRLYFGNQLKEPITLCYRKLGNGNAGEQAFKDDGTVEIVLDDSLLVLERSSAITLLHEMVHLQNGPNYLPHHGTLFQAEIHRLYMMGAYEGLL